MAESKEPASDQYVTIAAFVVAMEKVGEDKRTDPDEPEPVPDFINAVADAHEVLEQHLVAFEGIAAPFVMEQACDYTNYWTRAPRHHFTAPGNDSSIADLVWLTTATARVCHNPKLLSRDRCKKMNILDMARELEVFRDAWAFRPMPDETAYLAMRDRFIMALVYIISEGVTALVKHGIVTDAVDEKAERSESSSGPLKGLGQTAIVHGDEKGGLVGEMQRGMALYKAAEAVDQWLPRCVRVFPFVDAVFVFRRRFPVVDLVVPAPSAMPVDEKKFTAWVEKKVSYVMPEEFKRSTLDWACRLALPIGTAHRHTRAVGAPPPAYESFYRLEFGDDAHKVLDELSLVPMEKVYSAVYPTDDHRRYMRDSIVLNTFKQAWSNQFHVDTNTWTADYFIDSSCSLQHALPRLLDRNYKPVPPRSTVLRYVYQVLQLADAYYVFNGANLVRCATITQALWWWTCCLSTEFNCTLDDGLDVRERWIGFLRR